MKFTFALPLAAAITGFASVSIAADTKAKPDKHAEAMKAAGTAKAPAVRNWSDVDTNKDNLISADEMEAYLKANPGPLKK